VSRPFFTSTPVPEPDYDELDPGIREVVRLLFGAGFGTTDSGDGKTKGEFGADYPHVHIFVPVPPVDSNCMISRPQDIIRVSFGVTEVHRLFDLLRRNGISFHPDHYDEPVNVPLIQLDYGYPDSGVTITVLNVDDDLLARAKAGDFCEEP
jgi:hypothetical protein